MNKMTDEERKLAKTFPERVRLRDTGLHDDLSGAGQRVLTTAGQGYSKVTYVRADLAETPLLAGTTGYLELPAQKELDPEHEIIMSKETLRVWRFLLDHNPKALATYMDDLDLMKCRPESVSAERPPSWWSDLYVAWTEIVNTRIPGKRMVIDDTTLCRWANAMNCALAMTRPSANKRYSVGEGLDVRAFRRPVEFWLNDLDENDPDDRLDIDRGKRLLNQIDEWEKAHG